MGDLCGCGFVYPSYFVCRGLGCALRGLSERQEIARCHVQSDVIHLAIPAVGETYKFYAEVTAASANMGS